MYKILSIYCLTIFLVSSFQYSIPITIMQNSTSDHSTEINGVMAIWSNVMTAIGEINSRLDNIENSRLTATEQSTDTSKTNQDNCENDNCHKNNGKLKKLKKELKKLIIENDEYTPDEVRMMTDYALASEWIRITGHNELYCCHCKKSKPIANYYIDSIRKRCQKQGLDASTKPPKTCDEQQKVNRLCNPVNNRVYRVLRNYELSNEQVAKAQKIREKSLAKIGVETSPNKYK
jgi:hypothetical protein